MTMKVYYVVKSLLHKYPPCVSQIQMLNDLGVNVIVLYGSCESNTIKKFEDSGIKCVELCDPRGKFKGKVDKAYNWLSFRKRLKSFLKKINRNLDVVWFGNAETLLSMTGALKRYHTVITFLELYDKDKLRLKLYKSLANDALAVITCEETRAYLMQSWFKLKSLPYIMPNKPYVVPFSKNTEPTTSQGKELINKLQGHSFVISQGLFEDENSLGVVAEVLRDCYPSMFLVIMGNYNERLEKKLKEINPNILYVPFIPAPYHLEVTSNAHIGLLYYEPCNLNQVFCAPNKIYEYSKFGLPIIGNRIPGLINTIGRYNSGICLNFTYEEIKEGLVKIEDKYDEYSKNSIAFFNSTDNLKVMEQIVHDIKVCLEN